MNNELVLALRETAAVKKLTKDNPFSAKAYEKVADLVEKMDKPIREVDYHGIPGIGPKISESIQEFLTNGKISYLEKHRHLLSKRGLPWESLKLIDGVGDVLAQKLYEITKATNAEELKTALESGKLDKVFGEKTIENIKESLGQSRGKNKISFDEAMKKADFILGHIKVNCLKWEICGSIRRKKDKIGDIDFAVQTLNADRLFNNFLSIPGMRKIQAGSVKAAGWFQETKIDLYVFEEEHWESGLNFLTGCGLHNEVLRNKAIARGMKLSQYGLFDRETNKRLDDGSETSIYNLLGLNFIPPEERIGSKEFELYKIQRVG